MNATATAQPETGPGASVSPSGGGPESLNMNPPLRQTALYSWHLARQAKMTAFAGYAMPTHYPAGILTEHRHTRGSAGLFDVSHMGQIEVHGKEIAARLETELPVDLAQLMPGQQKYALLLNENGGIRDDLMVMHLGEFFLLVVNAAGKQSDFAYLQDRLGRFLDFSLRDDRALLALQGPAAAEVLIFVGASAKKLDSMKFMHVHSLSLAGIDCIVSRSGYTGEDGFEISVPGDQARSLADAFQAHHAVLPVGLGARDTLRLEAGLCLHGQDITPGTSPPEAGLQWAISPARRVDGIRPGGFPGADRILMELQQGTDRRRVGLLPVGRAPIRAGTQLYGETEEPLGEVTSGGFGPSLQRPVSMGYVPTEYAQAGTRLFGKVRGKLLPLTVAPLPFRPHRYYR